MISTNAAPVDAGAKADELIAAEIALQDKMWGAMNERADISRGQLFRAGIAQTIALHQKTIGLPGAFDQPPAVFPSDWSGFRDYGSDVANLVVAVAFLRQEIKRKIANGEDTTRSKRLPSQPYTKDQPNPV